ncbi:hypothetical protein B0H16DRAFT_1577136 [Mycena metata]|uniref:Uncharacterized protein n=1 Tax=Mycena metata TaxID=1033252 RepID=A0AAD7I6I2_9AGAR|nr:hypothetical protein B0H16DRAFT_1577136 [Mycena metata]
MSSLYFSFHLGRWWRPCRGRYPSTPCERRWIWGGYYLFFLAIVRAHKRAVFRCLRGDTLFLFSIHTCMHLFTFLTLPP